MKLKPGDIFWDQTSVCLVVLDHKNSSKRILRNIRLATMDFGALKEDELENYFELPRAEKYLGNISTLNEELINIFKQQGIL